MKKLLLISLLSFCSSIFRVCDAQLTVIHNFDGTSGGYPQGTLIISGNMFYGVTDGGGTHGDGVVFSMDSNGSNYKDLLNFNNNSFPQGAYPGNSIIRSGTQLFGTTYNGGIHGDGCVFSVDTNGNHYKDLLDCDFTIGAFPLGNLTLIGNVLYGLASVGGANNHGCVFSVDTDGTSFTDLHDFNVISGGYAPQGSMTLSVSGTVLYGMLNSGGANDSGAIFSIHTDGSNYKDIYDFTGPKGRNPQRDLLLAGNKLYGMALGGGANQDGVIFSVDTDGTAFTDLHDFTGTQGIEPFGDLILVGQKFYGMTYYGGIPYDSGLVFSIDTNGSGFTVLDELNGIDGAYPKGDLFLVGDKLYGMATYGGTSGNGVIFRLDTTNITTSIHQWSVNSGQWSVFPNPSTGIFTISVVGAQNLEPKNIEIYNVLGEKVNVEMLNPLACGQGDNLIDLSGQANGVYFYRLVSETGELIGEGKIVIQK
jgi:uncharacterized repeat protein (TIGR03803 family)